MQEAEEMGVSIRLVLVLFFSSFVFNLLLCLFNLSSFIYIYISGDEKVAGG